MPSTPAELAYVAAVARARELATTIADGVANDLRDRLLEIANDFGVE